VERAVVEELDILLHAENGLMGGAKAVIELNLLDFRASGKLQSISQKRPGGNGA